MTNVPYDPTHPVYEMTIVPAKGEFLVQDGKVLPVIEAELQDIVSGYMAWQVWTKQEDE